MIRSTDRFAATLLALSTLALAAPAGTLPNGLDPAARQRLAQREAPHLESLRAGAPVLRGELGLEARDRLRQAQAQSSPALAELRAGATDNDLLLVITIAVVVIALVVLL